MVCSDRRLPEGSSCVIDAKMDVWRDSYHSHVRRDVFPLVPRGGMLLDLGGGDGATAAELKQDGLVERVGVVDRVSRGSWPGLDFHYQGDVADPVLLQQIACDEGPFDTILCLDILEHLADPWGLLAVLPELLKPGGAVVASIPNVRHYSASLPLLLLDQWSYRDAGILDRTHLRFFVRETAVELMTSSGLTLETVVALRPRRRRDGWLKRLCVGPLESLFTLQYGLRVRRAC